jgi:UDP-glucose 4-epimerase
MSKTILITGGAGYIGSHTIIELLESTDFKVISIDNFSNSSPKTFDRIEQITGKRVPNYELDLCDFEALDTTLSSLKIDGVIHFAAYKSVPESVDQPIKYYHNNINSLINVLNFCEKYKISNFIFSSSCSVYGNINEMPVSEGTPLNKAVSPYAYTKQIGEQILEDYCNSNNLFSVVALRYFNPVGAHQSALIGEDPINTPTSLVPIITKFASGKMNKLTVFGSDYQTRDGSCVRDYIHVSDLANAHLKALNFLFESNEHSNFEIINIGTGNGATVFEAIQSFENVTGIKLNYTVSPRREGDVEAIYSDTNKSKKTLNWQAKYTIDDMMKSAWEWEKNVKY